MEQKYLLLLAALLLGITACKDAITTSDPKNVQTTTNISAFKFDSVAVHAGTIAAGSSGNFLAGFSDTDSVNTAQIISGKIIGKDSSQFVFDTSVHFPITIAARAKANIKIIFSPNGPGAKVAVLALTIKSTGGALIENDSLFGTGYSYVAPAQLCLSTTSIDFGSLVPNFTKANSITQTILVANCGTSVVRLTVRDSVPGQAISVDSSTLKNFYAVNDTAIFSVSFHPTVGGPVSGTIVITDTVTHTSVNVNYTGDGNISGFPYRDTMVIRNDSANTRPVSSSYFVRNPFSFPVTVDSQTLFMHAGADSIMPGSLYSNFPVRIAQQSSTEFKFVYWSADTTSRTDSVYFFFREAAEPAVLIIQAEP